MSDQVWMLAVSMTEGDAGGVDDRGRQGEMGAGDEAGHDVTQHKRLLELLEDEGHQPRADQDQRQVGYQRFYF